MNLALLFFSFFTVFFRTPAEPIQRWMIEVSDEGECFHQWTKEHQYEISYRKLPVNNWYALAIPSRLMGSLDNLSCVLNIVEDRKISWRNTIPNDPVFINQDDMTLISMPEAWDITQGGLTSRGDTIVVALIDDGYLQTHEDLISNIWHNRHEVPGDLIDNDGNGYVDDHVGLNIATGKDDHPVLNHGTSVAGIIGGRGNNSKGMAGVNWVIKMMLISGADFESELIEAYEYVLDMRKKYRLSNGNEGAFVVATNLSGGIDNEFAEDHPIWCGMYDHLGAEGILNVAAAPNHSISVDVDGDMPTTCTSPYLITVTNVDLTDVIVGNAGFGPVSIDIGAPGHGTITTSSSLQQKYKEFPGTSASAPHVTGVIGLIYSTTCTSFLNGINTNPAAIASKVRDIIFQTADVNNSLEDLTVTGKRLNAGAALEETVSECGGEVVDQVKILSVLPNPSPGETTIYFSVEGDTTGVYFELYTLTGALLNKYLVNQQEFQQGFLTLKTRPLAAGIYLMTIRNKKEKDTVKIFVY